MYTFGESNVLNDLKFFQFSGQNMIETLNLIAKIKQKVALTVLYRKKTINNLYLENKFNIGIFFSSFCAFQNNF